MADRPDSSEREADVAALREGYERLRAAVLSERPDGFRLGHGVMLTRGMLAWMRAFGALAPSTPDAERLEGAATASGASAPAGDAFVGEVVSPPGAEQLVAVLAQMTLAIAA